MLRNSFILDEDEVSLKREMKLVLMMILPLNVLDPISANYILIFCSIILKMKSAFKF